MRLSLAHMSKFTEDVMFERVRLNSLKISETDKQREVWLTGKMRNQTATFSNIHHQKAFSEDLLDKIGQSNEI